MHYLFVKKKISYLVFLLLFILCLIILVNQDSLKIQNIICYSYSCVFVCDWKKYLINNYKEEIF